MSLCRLSFGLFLFSFVAAVSAAEVVVFDGSVANPQGVKIEPYRVKTGQKDGMLVFTNKEKTDWPSVAFQGNWSIDPNFVFVMDVENLGTNTMKVCCRLDSPGANPDKGIRTISQGFDLEPGEKKRCEIELPYRLPKVLQDKLFGMRGYPGGVRGDTDGKVGEQSFDPRDLVCVRVFFPKPKEEHTVGIRRLFAGPREGKPSEILSRNAAVQLPPEKFFPMIDKYGQYIHADWPGKVKSDADLKKNREIEDAKLAQAAARPDWNQYGGWTKGPKLAATGSFRAEKVDGKWWLVDPEGRLFWSHGVDCIRSSTADTPTSDREYLFAELPFPWCVGKNYWVAHGYYLGKKDVKTYNFTASNLFLKYGDDWKRLSAETVHQRLRAWGMNTVANWSDPEIYKLRKTPYTATLGTAGPVIAGSKGYWGQFRDPFHPEFRTKFAETMKKQQETAADPWCIGFYVDNELGWGGDTSLASAALASPATQPAKIAVVEMLKEKYGTTDQLNASWGTSYADWKAMLASETAPDDKKEAIKSDLRNGYDLIAEQYFSVIRDELKKIAPDKLYFGCRFAWVNDAVVVAASKYCDVISFNIYDYTLSKLKLPEGIDKGVIIGEFHFGALDRGMLHTGLKPTADQAARAEAYEKYVRSGLEHPNIVGTHWFQYGDQATTGRGGDGENYQIGLVDVCDTPYPETIDAVKKIGGSMYEIRRGGKR